MKKFLFVPVISAAIFAGCAQNDLIFLGCEISK